MTEYNINNIMSLLQHRYPMLLVDKIIEVSEKKIIALKNVTINESFFQGHFPGNPVMPGVLIIESMAQAAGAGMMIASNIQIQNNDKTCYFASINNAKFKKPVIPGDTIIIEANIVTNKSGFFKFYCIAKTSGQIAAEAEILLYFK